MFKNILRTIRTAKNVSYTTNGNIINVIKDGKVGTEVTVKGWVKSLRKQKELIFLDISDGSTPQKLQVLLPNKFGHEKITVGASVAASGTLTVSPKGQLEISADSVNILGECDLSKGYPFAPRKQYAPEYVREYLHFRPRTKKFASLLRIRHRASLEIHKYLDKQGYVNVQTPILTSNDCEGAGEVFKALPNNLDLLKSMAKPNEITDETYFNKKVYLSVSGQLHLEAAAHALSKVYTFGPTFRAENSKTRFHLSEFYMLEAEIAFLNKLKDLIHIIEDLVKNVTRNILNENMEDVEICSENKVNFNWLEKKFQVISCVEANDILRNNFKTTSGKNGMTKENEIELVEYFQNVPVFVINWPKEEKPFYMKECLEDDSRVAALDLLAPRVGEIVGGSLREDCYEKLKSKIPENSHLDWYLDLRKFGGVPTGGFGLGFERYIQSILGINNVKDSIAFPRWPHNCDL